MAGDVMPQLSQSGPVAGKFVVVETNFVEIKGRGGQDNCHWGDKKGISYGSVLDGGALSGIFTQEKSRNKGPKRVAFPQRDASPPPPRPPQRPRCPSGGCLRENKCANLRQRLAHQ